MNPEITEHDAETNITTTREMTDEEYAVYIASVKPLKEETPE